MFWSKTPHTKAEHVAANKQRDIKVRAHQLHVQMAEEMAETAEKSQGFAENVDAEAGLDADMGSQIGRQKQVAKELSLGAHSKMRSMRGRVRLGRKKSRARGRSLGF